MVQRHPKQKRPTLPVSDLLEVGTPDIYYGVQQALQNEGVLLIDLDTREIIEGQVNVSDIGLILASKPLKGGHQMGFVQSTLSDTSIYKKEDIDAVLVLDQGSQTPNGPFYLLIQVIDDDEVEVWRKTALTVANKFVFRHQGQLHPGVFFGITSLSRSNGLDNSARRTALRKIQQFGDNFVSGISSTQVHNQEPSDDSGDEEGEF